MKCAKLGNSDLLVSEVSFGCMSLGEDDTQNKRLLHAAADGGITLFDTADLYQRGANEISIGKAFKGMRSQVLIASKVGNQWRADGSGWDWNPRKAYILQAIEGTLQRLQTDYLDLYQLHGGTLEDPIDETVEAFELLKQQGKIRAWGISSIRPNVIRAYVRRAGLSSVMMQYSLLDRRPEENCLDLLQENAIGVLARGSFAQGLLLNKAPKDYLSHNAATVALGAKAINSLAGTTCTAAEVAGRYVLHHPAVSTAVVGIRNMQQLTDALALAASSPLTEEAYQKLRAAVNPIHYEKHR